MREIDWQKERNRPSTLTPFAIAACAYVGLLTTGAAAAVGVHMYDKHQEVKTVEKSFASLDADTTTSVIELAPS